VNDSAGWHVYLAWTPPERRLVMTLGGSLVDRRGLPTAERHLAAIGSACKV